VEETLAAFEVVEFDLADLLLEPVYHLLVGLLVAGYAELHHLTPERPQGLDGLLAGVHVDCLVLDVREVHVPLVEFQHELLQLVNLERLLQRGRQVADGLAEDKRVHQTRT